MARRFNPIARNLKKTDLGGVIFGCKNYTFDECLSRKLFGLPAAHYSYVRNVSRGMTLFLFNYSNRMLHGIYEAADDGDLNIDTEAWTGRHLEITEFPAQVRMRIRMQCRPLKEEEFKPLIAGNYYEETHFWFELDKTQTQNLLSMFKNPPAPQRMLEMPQKWRASDTSSSTPCGQGGLSVPNTTILQPANPPSTFDEILPDNQNSVSSTHSKPWVSLFKPAAVLNTIAEDESCPFTFEVLGTVLEEAYPDLETVGEENPPTYPDLETLGEEENPPPNPDLEWSSSQEPPTCKESSSDNASMKNQTAPDGEWDFSSAPSVGEESLFETASAPSLTVSEEPSLFHECDNTPFFPDLTCLTEENVMTMASTDVQSVAVKLVRVLQEIKEFHSMQTYELDVLKQELEQSKAENESLRAPSSSLLSSQDRGVINSSLLLVGGFDGSSNLTNLDCYSPFYDSVKSLQPMGVGLLHASAVKMNDEVYILGGGNGAYWYDIVKSYNLAHDSWVTGPSLSRRKGNLAGIGLNNKIFALGGGDGVDCVSDVEMLDLNAGNWILCGSMLQKRYALAAAELRGMVYITGGSDGHQYLASVEGFDPRVRASIPLQSMTTKRGGHSLSVLNEKLYAIGGYDGATMVSSVEAFDPRIDSWMTIEPMNHERGCFGSATIGSSIYTIGGLQENGQVLSVVEKYSEGVGWEMVDTKAVGKRSSFATVLL